MFARVACVASVQPLRKQNMFYFNFVFPSNQTKLLPSQYATFSDQIFRN